MEREKGRGSEENDEIEQISIKRMGGERERGRKGRIHWVMDEWISLLIVLYIYVEYNTGVTIIIERKLYQVIR